MFTIPAKAIGLMREYEELVKEKVQKENWIDILAPISKEELRERILNDYELEICFDEPFVREIEERIGEDFIVFEGYEDEVFCLHEIEDFVLKPKNNKEVFIEEKIAA